MTNLKGKIDPKNHVSFIFSLTFPKSLKYQLHVCILTCQILIGQSQVKGLGNEPDQSGLGQELILETLLWVGPEIL